jgi:hypothetical protein
MLREDAAMCNRVGVRLELSPIPILNEHRHHIKEKFCIAVILDLCIASQFLF